MMGRAGGVEVCGGEDMCYKTASRIMMGRAGTGAVGKGYRESSDDGMIFRDQEERCLEVWGFLGGQGEWQQWG